MRLAAAGVRTPGTTRAVACSMSFLLVLFGSPGVPRARPGCRWRRRCRRSFKRPHRAGRRPERAHISANASPASRTARQRARRLLCLRRDACRLGALPGRTASPRRHSRPASSSPSVGLTGRMAALTGPALLALARECPADRGLARRRAVLAAEMLAGRDGAPARLVSALVPVFVTESLLCHGYAPSWLMERPRLCGGGSSVIALQRSYPGCRRPRWVWAALLASRPLGIATRAVHVDHARGKRKLYPLRTICTQHR